MMVFENFNPTDLSNVILPNASMSEERPPCKEDFSDYRKRSLELLKNLVDKFPTEAERTSSLSSVLILIGEHQKISVSSELVLSWSSDEHESLSSKLLSSMLSLYQKTLGELLIENECSLINSILSVLESKLPEFLSYPSCPHSLLWLGEQLGVTTGLPSCLTPRLLPPALNLSDSWLPCYKLLGCSLLSLLTTQLPPTHLVWYGRDKLIADALKPALHNQDVEVVRAAKVPLLKVTEIMHEQSNLTPSSPGPADHLVQQLLNSITLENSNTARMKLLIEYLAECLVFLGPGVARWVAKICALLCSELTAGVVPLPLLSLLPPLAGQVPGCLAREVTTLLPAVVRGAYTHSWGVNQEANMRLLASYCNLLSDLNPELSDKLLKGVDNLKINDNFCIFMGFVKNNHNS